MGDTLDIEDIEARLGAAPSCDCGRPSTQWCADSECGAESCDEHAGRSAPMGHEHRWSRYAVGAADIVRLIAEVRTLRALVETAHGDSIRTLLSAADGEESMAESESRDGDDRHAAIRRQTAWSFRKAAEMIRTGPSNDARPRLAARAIADPA